MLGNLFSFSKTPPEVKFNINQPGSVYDIATTIRTIVHETATAGKKIVIVCIGTDRSTGDALGPLTGTKLQMLNIRYPVFGTLDDPVHATNLTDSLTNIRSLYDNPFVIAIDACLGKVENVGYVSVGRGSVKPGAAVKKDLPAVGDAYITGIVNVGGFMEQLVLQSTRLNLVVKMADTIAHALSFGLTSVRQ